MNMAKRTLHHLMSSHDVVADKDPLAAFSEAFAESPLTLVDGTG